MTGFTDVLKREDEAAGKYHICLKEFSETENRKVRDHCHCTCLYQGVGKNNYNMKYWIPEEIPILFHNLSGRNVYLFIRDLGKSLTRMILVASQ